MVSLTGLFRFVNSVVSFSSDFFDLEFFVWGSMFSVLVSLMRKTIDCRAPSSRAMTNHAVVSPLFKKLIWKASGPGRSW